MNYDKNNVANLYKPILAAVAGPSPIVLTIVTAPSNGNVAGGVPLSTQKLENYILLSALPDELRQRVALAVQALVTAI